MKVVSLHSDDRPDPIDGLSIEATRETRYIVHTDSSSSGQGHAYIASLNGQQFGQSANGTAITIPGVATIVLVPSSASGGESSSGGATAGDVRGQQGQVLGVSTTASAGQSNNAGTAGPGMGSEIAGIGNLTPAVPVTGVLISGAALLLIVGGLALTGAGAIARRHSDPACPE